LFLGVKMKRHFLMAMTVVLGKNRADKADLGASDANKTLDNQLSLTHLSRPLINWTVF
jgi:hypothetical protein